MKNLWRLRPLLRNSRVPFLLAILTLLALTASQLTVPTIIEKVIDIGILGNSRVYLIRSAGILVGIGIALTVLTFSQRYLSEWVASHIGYELRNMLYDHIQHLPFTFHDHAQTGQLISRSIEDVRSIERFTGFGIVELFRLALLLVGIITLLLLANARLAAIALLPLLPLMIMTSSFGRKIGSYFLAVDKNLGELSSRLQENASGAQVVRAFAREPHELNRFNAANRQLYHSRITVISAWSRIMPTSHLLVTLGTILILWFGGQMVINGEMSIGEVVAFNGYLLLLASPAQQLTWLVNLAGEAVAGVQRTFEILDIEPAIQSPPDPIPPRTLTGRVTFDQVCFKYQGEKRPALEDINLQVEPNQIIALVGPTGSGKTSLVHLIPRFYDVTKGSVSIDGIDVRQMDLVTLRRQIGLVLQTSLLFSTTIKENIAYGHPEASMDEIIAAARAAQAHEFIQALPEGYETVVGERGVTLSGGQRQRVAIARALLLDPRILVLDDSTSSVDTRTEHLIQIALANLMKGRTTFVIAHRLSSVREADLILVMNKGRIVERGKHNDLLKANGLYSEFYQLQLRDQDVFRKEMELIEQSRGMHTQFQRPSQFGEAET